MEVCVKFPAHLAPTKYDGYLYNRNARKLYSFKSGKLKPIKPVSAHRAATSYGEDGWRVSVSGEKKFLGKRELQGLYPEMYEIPFAG